jgi:hypothetical protein
MDDQLILDREEELRVAMEAALAGLHVAIPVQVLKDSDGKTVSMRPTLKARQVMPDGTTKEVDYPDMEGLPRFASGGGLTDTHPVKQGDEALAILSSRSFWNWRELGGTQSQVDGRKHDLSDAVYLSGIRSVPRDLKGMSTDTMQRRTDDKKSLHDISHTAITTIREFAVQQVNGAAIQSELKGARHVIDPKSILTLASKILLNC